MIYNYSKIDSFTLLILLKDLEIRSSTFLSAYQKLYSSGEVEDSEEFYNSYAKTENKNAKTFLKYKKVSRIFKGERKDFIQIMITSKLLRKNYFNGLNKINIKDIYNYIIDDDIINLSEESFLNSYVTDIDICKDYKANENEFKALKDMLKENVLSTKEHVVKTQRINSAVMFGIQFNERHKATPTKPFAKLYFKSEELQSAKTLPFTNVNLNSYFEDIKNGIARFEVTIKNFEHKKRLGIQDVKTLYDLLEIPETKLDILHTSIVREYYEQDFRVRKSNTEMTPTECIEQGFLNRIYKLQPTITSEELIFECTRDIEKGSKRSKVKKQVLEAIALNQNKKPILANSIKQKTALDIVKNLGIFED